jgi:Zn-dependent alcohol dehydrogenase
LQSLRTMPAASTCPAANLHASHSYALTLAWCTSQVCLLGCGIATGWGAVYNTAQVKKGSSAAVFGLGAVGLACIEACVGVGCKRIFAIDTSPEKEAFAKDWGATDFVNPKARPLSPLLAQQILFVITLIASVKGSRTGHVPYVRMTRCRVCMCRLVEMHRSCRC